MLITQEKEFELTQQRNKEIVKRFLLESKCINSSTLDQWKLTFVDSTVSGERALYMLYFTSSVGWWSSAWLPEDNFVVESTQRTLLWRNVPETTSTSKLSWRLYRPLLKLT